ncbi:MAG: ribosome biogenesis GTPase YlqF [Candidatus Faecisoma sp.]|nr:ribosome biogenesis GTPase YlqF [Acholeplasma sp.]MDY2892278.1 ribosome biogenesis GTPase YlqF [Candidatus Faecisoma sp.]
MNNENKSNINWYPGHMAKTKRQLIEQNNLIDVYYEVIDARMPYSSKIKNVDDIIKNKPKILILTKYDLCDTKETNKWINYYKQNGYNVIALNLESNNSLKPLIDLTLKVAEPIIKKREEKSMKMRKIRVAILGIPNVGKSTLINRLVGRKAVNVGNKPGVTKQLNWIRINEQLELLDTPGILWPKLEENTVALNLASLSAIKEDILPLYDVCNHIIDVLSKYYKEQLKERYNIDEIDDDIYTLIGKKRGCLIKGGEIDYDKVVNVIMNDVRNGYFKNITFDRFK